MILLGSVLAKTDWLDQLIEGLGQTPEEALALDEVAFRLAVAGIIGWLLGQVYRRTFTGKRFSPTLPDTHTLLSMGGAMIWVVVGNNLVRAFGLAGTIGLIRYRTVVRDPKDTTILLFSMVLGMACGLGHYKEALVGGMVIVLALVLLHLSHRKERAQQLASSQDLLNLLEGDDAPPDAGAGDSPKPKG